MCKETSSPFGQLSTVVITNTQQSVRQDEDLGTGSPEEAQFRVRMFVFCLTF